MDRKYLVSVGIAIVFSISCFAQSNKNTPQKSTTQTTTANKQKPEVVITPEKPETGDKAVPGRKGPEGQQVYEGIKGGIYYINKNGNKTYLKEDDKIVAGKKGPDGQKVYAGPQGGEYYINKNGNKIYLRNNKK